jgi:transketolase
MVGMAAVNFADSPAEHYDGFWGACSTYGSFFLPEVWDVPVIQPACTGCSLEGWQSDLDCGHSGPETADDSRTHFGIFAPGVTQLFPKGSIINLHPWEHNEVPVLLGEALKKDVPIIALHLTRPAVEFLTGKRLECLLT